MSANVRLSDACLDLLKEQGEEVNFYQAVRMLERTMHADQKLRFSVVNSESFKPNFIDKVALRNTTDGHQFIDVSVNGYGATGLHGPIPQIFSEMLQRANVKGAEGQENPNQFLDVFHHRIVSLLYNVKKQLNPMLFNHSGENQSLMLLFSAIAGFNYQQFFDYLPASKSELCQFAPAMANRRVNYSLLVTLLEAFLDLDVDIVPNQGAWQTLPDCMRTKLSSRKRELSDCQRAGLGNGIGLGSQFWSPQGAIKIILHTTKLARFKQFLPGKQSYAIEAGEKHDQLCRFLSFITDGKYRIHVELKLTWDQVSESRLPDVLANGDRPSYTQSMSLGRTSWLKHSLSTNQIQAEELNDSEASVQFSIAPNLHYDSSLNSKKAEEAA